MMQQVELNVEMIKELNAAMQLVGDLGFIVGLSFGIFIGWILHSALHYYYRE